MRRNNFLKLGWLAFGILSLQCQNNSTDMSQTTWKENQITKDKKGHFLNPVQAFSPQDEYIVYDGRNDGGKIGETEKIERVNIKSGQTEVVYTAPHQTKYGPGVGAAAYHPIEDKVIFIHGLLSANKERPYDLSRRLGVAVDMKSPGQPIFLDARDVTPPFTVGALRGGSHAHSWSADGQWITYTYNDDVMNALAKKDTTVKDLRLIAVMAPWGKVEVAENETGENYSGEMFNMAVSEVVEQATPGSDEIEKAYEDGWIGTHGYVKADGQRQKRAVAFLGDVRAKDGSKVTEVYVVDLPEEKPDLSGETQLAGTERTRPLPLSTVKQRRVTFTTDRKYPGVQGPRQWMKSSPDGQTLYFMMKDDMGRVQVYSVPTLGGDIKAVTSNDFSIDTSFDIDPSGQHLAYGHQEKVYTTSIASGETQCLTPNPSPSYSQLHSIQWSRDGQMLAYNRLVDSGDGSYFQIFMLTKS